MTIPSIPEGWELVVCDWPSPKLHDELIIVSADRLRYRPRLTNGWGPEAPCTEAMRLREVDD